MSFPCIKICPNCGRGYVPDTEHHCDKRDTYEHQATVVTWWFLGFCGLCIGLVLWLILK